VSMVSWASDVFEVAAVQTVSFCTGALVGLVISQLLVWIELRAIGSDPSPHLRSQWLTGLIITVGLITAVLLLLITRRWEMP